MTAKRGRPRKQRFVVPSGLASPITASERNDLRTKLLQLPRISLLGTPDFDKLVMRLSAAIAFYRATEIANKAYVRGPGNKTKRHLSGYLHDCVQAWCEATGETRAPLWENDYKEESPAISIARTGLSVANGKPYTASLRQQAKHARLMVNTNSHPADHGITSGQIG
jgi:hypothetical protein